MAKSKFSLIFLLFLVCSYSICDATPFSENKTVKVSSSSSSQKYPVSGTIKAGAPLRLRQWPWGKVLSLHGNGTKVSVLGTEGEFYKVKVNGSTGYLHKNYVSIPNQPASRKEPAYPANTKKGGYIPRPSATSTAKKSSTVTGKVRTGGTPLNVRSGPWGSVVGSLKNNASVKITGSQGDFYKISHNGKTRYVHKNYVSTPTKAATQKAPKPPSSAAKKLSSSRSSTYKASVIGKASGDGTLAGALTWAADQLPSGQRRGYNHNNGQTSRNSKCWSGWCLAFIATAWGRKIPEMRAPSAIQSYYNFRRAGKIKTNRNPPAGAVMFTDKTSTNPYGHIFMATGKKTSSGEPIVITNSGSGIKELTLSQMIGSRRYLGWAMPR